VLRTLEVVAPRGHALRPQARQLPRWRLGRLQPHPAECRFSLGLTVCDPTHFGVNADRVVSKIRVTRLGALRGKVLAVV